MIDLELQREIRNLQGDVNITKLAINNVQEEMKRQLNGEMGKDIDAVLNGEKIVKVSTHEKYKHKIMCLIKRLFRTF